jgi:hypothetical protein|uniref:Glycosyltransferase n=1 Tax=viral metagenome TaxID=1070528 RepID=A0A6C0INP7_9ZZZZ
MLVLNVGDLHKKNKWGLEKMANYLNIEVCYGTREEIEEHEVIYSPGIEIDTSKYPTKRFLFGPHFSTFPTEKVMKINNIHNNSVYIQPSKWAKEVWEPHMRSINIPTRVFSFPVDIDMFKPDKQVEDRNRIFIYFKRRNPEELTALLQLCKKKNIVPVLIDYMQKYKEEDYIDCLQNAKFGIILDAHESQGFAIEEALSCDVPLLVWNVKTMNQEYKSRYREFGCTSVPYWDERCGEVFYEEIELEETFNKFVRKLPEYEPRKYIVENLAVEIRGKELEKLLKDIK